MLELPVEYRLLPLLVAGCEVTTCDGDVGGVAEGWAGLALVAPRDRGLT